MIPAATPDPIGVSGSSSRPIAVLPVIALNALFAFVQEMQAERAVEALAQFLPQQVRVLREGKPSELLAVELVPAMAL